MTTGDVVYSLRFSLIKILPEPGFDLGSTAGESCVLTASATQLGNFAVEITQMTLESAWIYEIHHFQFKFVSIYRKEVEIIALTYFLATLPILATKIAITRYLVIVSIWD